MLSNLADVARLQGDFERAQQQYEAGLALYREVGNNTGSAGMLYGLGYVALHQGNHVRAEALFLESLALYRERQYSRGIAFALIGIGLMAQAHGEPERAVRLWAVARRILNTIGVPRLDVADRADYTGSAAAVRTHGDARWTAAWVEGQAPRT